MNQKMIKNIQINSIEIPVQQFITNLFPNEIPNFALPDLNLIVDLFIS